MARSALIQLVTPTALAIQPAANLAASYAASPTIGSANTRPIYATPIYRPLAIKALTSLIVRKATI